jgi:hypothetical protein
MSAISFVLSLIKLVLVCVTLLYSSRFGPKDTFEPFGLDSTAGAVVFIILCPVVAFVLGSLKHKVTGGQIDNRFIQALNFAVGIIAICLAVYWGVMSREVHLFNWAPAMFLSFILGVWLLTDR